MSERLAKAIKNLRDGHESYEAEVEVEYDQPPPESERTYLVCKYDEDVWPCDLVVVLDALSAAQAEVQRKGAALRGILHILNHEQPLGNGHRIFVLASEAIAAQPAAPKGDVAHE